MTLSTPLSNHTAVFVCTYVWQQYGENANVIFLNDECEFRSLESIKGLECFHAIYGYAYKAKRIKMVIPQICLHANSSDIFIHTYKLTKAMQACMCLCKIKIMDKGLTEKYNKFSSLQFSFEGHSGQQIS